jgi:acyl-CoA thioester hydrolase
MNAKRRVVLTPPEGALITQVSHKVAFYETDAMGVVHHSNYVRYLEHARVEFLNEHDRPYEQYIELGFHVPVTRVEVNYKRPCRFAEVIDIVCWPAWMRHASFGFAYKLTCGGEFVASAETSHAVVDATGRPQRIPADMHARMSKWLGPHGVFLKSSIPPRDE